MAKPTFAQMEEFFRQVAADKISSASFQTLLDGLTRVRPLTLEEYQGMVRYLRCGGSSRCMGGLELKRYNHVEGWKVEGFSEKQWLYTKCFHCGSEVSLRHWGIERGLLKQV
jgi:hypothetical protein